MQYQSPDLVNGNLKTKNFQMVDFAILDQNETYRKSKTGKYVNHAKELKKLFFVFLSIGKYPEVP